MKQIVRVFRALKEQVGRAEGRDVCNEVNPSIMLVERFSLRIARSIQGQKKDTRRVESNSSSLDSMLVFPLK